MELVTRLCVGRDSYGQCELKRCATRGVGGGPQAAAMRLNDRSTDGQAHAGSIILGREECLEDLVCLLRRESTTGVTD